MKNIEKLIELMNDNPDLPVVPMVETEVVGADTYSRWIASFGDCRVSDFYIGEERVYTDKDDLVEELVENEYFDLDKPDEEIWQIAEKRANKLMKKAIIVNIDLPNV